LGTRNQQNAYVTHEVRDGLYGFIALDDLEKKLIDSAPFQRLRCIHQLAMCYQVYPGATHTRFAHSLGVMDMATRIFDTVRNAWGGLGGNGEALAGVARPGREGGAALMSRFRQFLV
jgi:hypothetical protein